MNSFVKKMLQAQHGGGDGRNPYGSRGGYVSSGRGRSRDRERSDYGEDYMYGGFVRPMPRYDYGWDDLARGGRGGSRGGGRGGRGGGRDYADYGDYGDYADYGDYGDMARGRDYGDYGDMAGRDYERYDMARRGGQDGGETEYGKMSKKDIEEWKKALKNEDGTSGEHFKKEQLQQLARQMGLNMKDMGGEDTFFLTVNMLYSDYCSVAKRFGVDVPEYYAELAKAFLKDKDFDGEPEEKLWLYYQCIAKKE